MNRNELRRILSATLFLRLLLLSKRNVKHSQLFYYLWRRLGDNIILQYSLTQLFIMFLSFISLFSLFLSLSLLEYVWMVTEILWFHRMFAVVWFHADVKWANGLNGGLIMNASFHLHLLLLLQKIHFLHHKCMVEEAAAISLLK